MLSEICAEIRNYFTKDCDRFIGDFAIIDGHFSPSIVFPTEYFRIVGSRLNDGVHKVSDLVEHPLQDEEFHGAVWIMSIPKDFLNLVEEIQAWQEKNGQFDSVAMSPFSSETFGGYSYMKGVTGGNSSEIPTWKSQYASRLNIYRRIREL